MHCNLRGPSSADQGEILTRETHSLVKWDAAETAASGLFRPRQEWLGEALGETGSTVFYTLFLEALRIMNATEIIAVALPCTAIALLAVGCVRNAPKVLLAATLLAALSIPALVKCGIDQAARPVRVYDSEGNAFDTSRGCVNERYMTANVMMNGKSYKVQITKIEY